MDEYSMNGIENILDYFNVDRTYKLIKEQLTDNIPAPSGTITDHLKPLWVRYKNLEPKPEEYLDASAIADVRSRFDVICRMFIDVISERYGISLDTGWFDKINPSDIHAIALVMYTFFVLDIEANIKEVLYNYIISHADDLAEHFGENLKSRKDSSYLAMKKMMDHNYAIIGSNINNICTWILGQMSGEEFMSYLDADYVPLSFIKALFEDGHMGGDFMRRIYDYFVDCHTIRSRIIFDLISIFKVSHNHPNSKKEDES